MSKHTEFRQASLACNLAVLLLLYQVAAAAPRAARGIVTHVAGTAEYQVDGQVRWQRLKTGMALSEGTSVRTAEGSVVDMALTTGAIVRLGGNSAVHLDKLTLETKGLPGRGTAAVRQTHLTLQQGQLFSRVRKLDRGSSYDVASRFGVMQVTGTEFMLRETGDQFLVRVMSGSVGQQISDRIDPQTGKTTPDPTDDADGSPDPTDDTVAALRSGDQTIRVLVGQQISGGIDPQTGKATLNTGQPMLAPTNDPIAAQYAAFKNETFALEGLVLEGDVVDIGQLVQLLRIAVEGKPEVVTVGNPASMLEVSPSVP